jgi:hypothetical protein
MAKRKLTPKQKAMLRPIVAGSGYTQGELRNDSGNATTVRYGGAERQTRQNVATAGQMQRDTGDFYDAYLKDLAQHQQNIAAYQKGAQDSVAAIGQSLGSDAVGHSGACVVG